jgi:hypothetical protein
MTICLSYIHKGKEIIAFCDSLGYRDGDLSYDHKKYVYLKDRKLLFLFSGYDAPIDDFKNGIKNNAWMFRALHYDIFECAKVAKNLFNAYSNLRGPWEVLVCGFYKNSPQIAIFNSNRVIPQEKIGVIGSDQIKHCFNKYTFDFDDLERSQVLEKLGKIIYCAMIIENVINKESSQTGGPIRRLILSLEGLEILEPLPFP